MTQGPLECRQLKGVSDSIDIPVRLTRDLAMICRMLGFVLEVIDTKPSNTDEMISWRNDKDQLTIVHRYSLTSCR